MFYLSKLSFKKLVCLKIFILIFVHSDFASNSKLDSLLLCLSKSSLDTKQVNLINKICWEYLFANDYRNTNLYVNQGKSISKKLLQLNTKPQDIFEIKRGYSSLVFTEASVLYWKSNLGSAIIKYTEALNLKKEIKDRLGEAKSYRSIADCYYYLNDYNNTILYYQNALDVAISIKDKSYSFECLLEIADTYYTLSNYPKALSLNLTALKLKQNLKQDLSLARCFKNIGNIYNQLAKFERAQQYYFKALQIKLDLKSTQEIGIFYQEIASNYYFQKKYLEANHYYQKSIIANRNMGDSSGVANCYIGLGNIHSDEVNPNINNHLAIYYYLKAIKIHKALNYTKALVVSYVNISGLYYNLLQYKLAEHYAELGLKLAKEVKSLYNLSFAYQRIAKTQFELGKYKEAYLNYIQFKTLTDSIFNVENSKQLSDLKTNFEVSKKETELRLIAKAEKEKLRAIALSENHKQNIIIASIISILLVVIIFSLFLYRRFKITSKQKSIIESQKKEVDKAYHLLHEKNKEITDSIIYARRIQNALITPERYLDKHLNRLQNF